MPCFNLCTEQLVATVEHLKLNMWTHNHHLRWLTADMASRHVITGVSIMSAVKCGDKIFSCWYNTDSGLMLTVMDWVCVSLNIHFAILLVMVFASASVSFLQRQPYVWSSCQTWHPEAVLTGWMSYVSIFLSPRLSFSLTFIIGTVLFFFLNISASVCSLSVAWLSV